MEFANDPGALPFATIRDAKWLVLLDGVPPFVEITGVHGCELSHQVAEVLHVKPYLEPPPAHLAAVYAGKPLIVIALRAARAADVAQALAPLVSTVPCYG